MYVKTEGPSCNPLLCLTELVGYGMSEQGLLHLDFGKNYPTPMVKQLFLVTWIPNLSKNSAKSFLWIRSSFSLTWPVVNNIILAIGAQASTQQRPAFVPRGKRAISLLLIIADPMMYQILQEWGFSTIIECRDAVC